MIIGQIYFYLLAALSLLGALVVVTNKNPIRGAMGLLLTVVSLAGLFLALHAEFIAFIQLIVYAGAIVVLFLFVIMLLGPDAAPPRDHHGRVPRAFAGVLFGLAAAGAILLMAKQVEFAPLQRVAVDFGTVDAIGRVLFTDGVVPFELASALLMVAIVGAVAVARGRLAHEMSPAKASPAAAATARNVEAEKHP
ncbi:NADH-quinone oxidoreductase subunit J [Pendulispora rubella]|uniref:NADH-quinone oxidoreductase subunit J n=1 Tax=Pendulispora rubella TaxID=2741070 RepID=A0ABZ2LID6_9BACT